MGSTGGKLGFGERLRRLFGPRDRLVFGGNRTRRLEEPRESVSGARFGLVGLTDLREHLGERWPELAERVHGLAQTVISRHLTRGDVFDAHGEDGYVVLFAQLSKTEADFKCRVIAKEISAKLLGSEWSGLARLDSVTIELEREVLIVDDLAAALDQAVAKGAPLEEEAPAARSPAFVRRQGPAASPPTATVIARAPSRGPPTLVETPDAGEPPVYAPVWDFGSNAMLRFRLLPPVAPAGQPEPEVVLAAKQDVAALTKALFDLGRLAQLGRRLAVICPLHLTTLGRDGWRSQLVRMLKDCPEPQRRLLTLEFIVPEKAPAAWPRALQARCAGLPVACTARIGPQGDLSGLRPPAGLTQVNLDLPEGFPGDRAGVAQLDAFAHAASAAGLACGVLGLEDRPLVLAASAAGFSQLSGPAVHEGVHTLTQAVRFDLASLYRDLLPSAAS
ncbi:MAG: hypothetical protein IT546_00335 [Caulobacteraceae bacterium]|nr:hypothetical protein [Caulobacteraceae bacterium]